MNILRTIGFIVCLGTITINVSAIEKGAIDGIIVDQSTGLGLSSVNIAILGSAQGTVSSGDGRFRITGLDPGEYSLRFSLVGYKPFVKKAVKVKAREVTSITIQLEPTVIEMEKVVVTASRHPRLLEQTPDITIIQNFIEVRAMGAKRVAEIVEYMPGISTLGGTGSGQPFKRTVSINGMPAYYSLVLLDGKRVLSSHIHTGANVNVIPPEHIERIELVKGAASALYGTDGMGGTLNIITRKGAEKTRASFTTFGGSRNTFHSGLSLSGKISKGVYYSLLTSWEESDGEPIVGPVFRKGKLSYSMFHVMEQLNAQISPNLKGTASFHYMNTKAPYRQDPMVSWYLTPELRLEYTLSEALSLQTSGYYSKWKSQQNGELNEIASPEILLDYGGFENHQILLGTEYIYRNFARTRVTEHDQQAVGLFIQDEISWESSCHLLIALRMDKVENLAPVWSPKLSALYHLSERLDLRASIGRGFRAPTVQDLYETLYSHPGDIHYRAGNPDLQPEYSTTFNAGISWRWFDRLSLMINGYYYAIDNMITPVDHGLEDPTLYFSREQIPFVSDSLVYIYRRENIHQGRIVGGEFKLLWNLIDGYTFEAGLCFSHNKNLDTGKSLPYYPGKNLSLKLQGKQPVTKWLTVSGFIGLNATMGRKIWRFKHDREQQLHLDDYQKLDTGLSLIFRNGCELFLNIDNVLAQEIHIYEDVEFIIEGTRLYRMGFRFNSR